MRVRMLKVWIALALAVCLALTGCAGGGQTGSAENQEPVEATAVAEVEAEAEPAEAESAEVEEPAEAESAEVEETTEEVPEVAEAEEAPAEESPTEEAAPVEKSGNIVILYTSDVHCGVDQGFGYAGVKRIADYHRSQGDEVILVDDGDFIQGEVIGSFTEGGAIIELMNQVGYDLAIPGNHEFDYGMDRFFELVEMADFPVISCNFREEGELVLEAGRLLERGGHKIGFVGVTTPNTIVESTPAIFQDAAGEFIYDFMQGDDGTMVYDAVQTAVDDLRAQGAEYVFLMAHLGNSAADHPWNYEDVVSHTTGIDVVTDGHSHDRDQVVMRNAAGEDVIRTACGTKLASVGWCKIDADGQITNGLYDWTNPISLPELMGLSDPITESVEAQQAELEAILGVEVGRVEAALTILDPENTTEDGRPIRLIRRQETNLGDFVTDALRVQTGADIGLCNGGGIRTDLGPGTVTQGDVLAVHPFGNEVVVIEATGQQILDALEWGARLTPAENGGFLQVSGLSFEIHVDVPDPCTMDENHMFTGIRGERRVQNARVGDEPIDPTATYTVAGSRYTLLQNGDGHTAFAGSKVIIGYFKTDYEVIEDYLINDLGGVVGEGYADPYGQGRIVIVEGE